MDAERIEASRKHGGVAAVHFEIFLHLRHAFRGEHRFRAPLHDVGNAVEFCRLPTQPQFVEGRPSPHQRAGNDGIAAPRARKTRRFGERTELYGAFLCALHLKNTACEPLFAHESLVCRVVQDDGALFPRVRHPLGELRRRIRRARRVVWRTDIDDVRVRLFVGHGQKAVFRSRVRKDDPAPSHDVRVHIHGIDGVGHEHGIVRIEYVEDIPNVALRAVGNENFVLLERYPARCVIAANRLFQEGIALFGAVAAESFLFAHFARRLSHRRNDCGRERLRHVADAHAQNFFIGVRLRIGSHLFCDGGKQVTFV